MKRGRTMRNVTINGRSYRFPQTPTVVVCIDGSEPGYIERAIDVGLAPNFARLMTEGSNLSALSVIPSFTDPNNISSSPAVRRPCMGSLATTSMIRKRVRK